MKCVIIGGTGLIGSKLVNNLRRLGHEAIAASPSSGVNTLTGEGLPGVLAGAEVVVDVTNSPSFEAEAVLKFFDTSTRNLLAAETRAGVRHHVALSVVGTDRHADVGYFRAKMAQERLIEAGKIPYTIVRATQFFEFMGQIVNEGTRGNVVRSPPAPMQAMAADDVAAALADVAIAPPLNRRTEIAGPEMIRMDEASRRYLRSIGDPRDVVTDVEGTYFGMHVNDGSLVPVGAARLGPTRYDDWLAKSRPDA